MRAHFGHQGWWPASTAFEMCVGAILTQNTSWSNVELALTSIKAAGLLDPRKLLALPERKLARLLRSTGYFNVKAKRLRCRFLGKQPGWRGVEQGRGGRKDAKARLFSIAAR